MKHIIAVMMIAVSAMSAETNYISNTVFSNTFQSCTSGFFIAGPDWYHRDSDTMFSNLNVSVTTTNNTVIPRQYKSMITTYPPSGDRWLDEPDGSYYFNGLSAPSRDNPDVKIIEVRKVKTLSFTAEGKEFKIVISDELISSTRMRRKVESKETWEVEK